MFVKDAWSTPAYSEFGTVYLDDLRFNVSAVPVPIEYIKQIPEIRLVLRDIAGFDDDWKDTGERVQITFPDFGEFGLGSPILGSSQLPEQGQCSFDDLESLGQRQAVNDSPELPEADLDETEQDPELLPLSDPLHEAVSELPASDLLVPVELPPPPELLDLPPPPEALKLPPPPEALAPIDLSLPPGMMEPGERLVPIDHRDSGHLQGSSSREMSFTGLIMTTRRAPPSDEQSTLGGRAKSVSGQGPLLTSTSQTMSPFGQPEKPAPALGMPTGSPLPGLSIPRQTTPPLSPPLAPNLQRFSTAPSQQTRPGATPPLPPPLPTTQALASGPTLPPPMPAAPSLIPTASSLPPPMPLAPSVSIMMPMGTSPSSASNPVVPPLPPPLPVYGVAPAGSQGRRTSGPALSPVFLELADPVSRVQPDETPHEGLSRRERGKGMLIGFPVTATGGRLFAQDASGYLGKPPGLTAGLGGALGMPRQPTGLLAGSPLLRPSPPAGKLQGSPGGGP
jgi:hypothetical protein